MAAACLEKTDPDPTFEPAHELLALWDTKGIIADQSHRLTVLLDAFTAVVTTGAPMAKIVAYWDVLLNSKLGPLIATRAKHAIPNGKMIRSGSDIGLKIVLGLFRLAENPSSPEVRGSRETLDVVLYQRRNSVLRSLIAFGFKHTWISEALFMSHHILADHDAVSKKKHLKEVLQDIQLPNDMLRPAVKPKPVAAALPVSLVVLPLRLPLATVSAPEVVPRLGPKIKTRPAPSLDPKVTELPVVEMSEGEYVSEAACDLNIRNLKH